MLVLLSLATLDLPATGSFLSRRVLLLPPVAVNAPKVAAADDDMPAVEDNADLVSSERRLELRVPVPVPTPSRPVPSPRSAADASGDTTAEDAAMLDTADFASSARGPLLLLPSRLEDLGPGRPDRADAADDVIPDDFARTDFESPVF